MKETLKIALVGNPNTGKTSLFNALTGMNQKVGNYPGITVDKKTGYFDLNDDTKVELIDLPGTYSLNPNSLDEEIVLKVLTNNSKGDYPEAIIFVADSTNLKRNLYFFSQIRDLGIPSILVLNMLDLVERRGIEIDIEKLSEKLKCPVLAINARKSTGIDELKNTIAKKTAHIQSFSSINFDEISGGFIDKLQLKLSEENQYLAWLIAVQTNIPSFISEEKKRAIRDCAKSEGVNIEKIKIKETIKRYQFVNELLKEVQTRDHKKDRTYTSKFDRLFTHKVFGYVIFFGLMFLLFQAIYSWASIPMDYIDNAFTWFSSLLNEKLPPGPLTELITEGVIPGIGGIVIFIPQIAILFAFISIMEDSGYMSRVVFLMDKLMRKFGMSGKSVVPLMSGMACAVPAIMSTRTISDWKERLLTIFTTPFVTCSARLPVYSIIIAIVIPDRDVYGLFNLQGLVLMAMYLIGFAGALLTAYIANKLLKIRSRNTFIIEMPSYKLPYYKNVVLDIVEKTKAFVFNAGKIIFTLSIILWVLASYGPGDRMNNAQEIVQAENPQLNTSELNNKVAAYKLKNSYIGIFGQTIEPAIKPLGFDWKIGIALISSLAAREVFVGTMATIYSVGSADGGEELTVLNRMRNEVNDETGLKVYNLAVGWSLLIFYAFAMQCISTIAIVKRETNSWRWPIIQTVFMTGLAYISSFIVYQLLK